MTGNSGGLVAAGNIHTAQAAASVLEDGGNAFDAMIAALWMTCVSEPVLSSLGGGGFLLAGENGEIPEVIDFFAHTPLVKLPAHALEFERMTADFGSVHQEFHTGQGSVATPGFVAGLFVILDRHGTMPMRRLAQPAIDLATKGHALDPLQAYILDVVSPIMLASGEARRLYGSKKTQDQAMKAGEIFRNLDLANAIERIAIEGPDLFYEGELAQVIAHEQSEAGLLTKDDLLGYRVEIHDPITTIVKGTTVHTNPVPSSGGTLVALQLDLLSRANPEVLRDPRGWTLALLQAMETSSRARHQSGLNTKPDNEAVRKIFDQSYVDDFSTALAGRAEKLGGTTHISIVDKKGNVAAATASNGEGCGHIVPGTGIMLNNMLGEEDINPMGFFNWECGTRISSMMAPTLLHHLDGSRTILGSGGSNRIKSAVFQVSAQIIFDKMGIEDAVNHPRLHLEKGHLHIEGGFEPDLVDLLISGHPDAHQWEDKNLFFGGVHVAKFGESELLGAADSRRGGVIRQV